MSASRDVEAVKGRGVVSWTATLGLVVHAAADGVALGAAATTNQTDVEVAPLSISSSFIIKLPSSGYCLLGNNVAQGSGQFWSGDVPAPRGS